MSRCGIFMWVCGQRCRGKCHYTMPILEKYQNVIYRICDENSENLEKIAAYLCKNHICGKKSENAAH